MLWRRRTIKSQANAFTSAYEIELRCHVGSCKYCPKNPSVADQKEHARSVRTHTHIVVYTVSGLSQQSPLVWKAIAGYNNYSLAGLLVVGPLFQQSGFSLPLDRDQVRLHNTPLFAECERKRERERENCRHVSLRAHICINRYVYTSMYVWVCFHCGNTAHVCEHVHVFELWLLGPPHPLSLQYWVARPPSYLPNLHCYIIIATAFCYLSTNNHFESPDSSFPPPGSV